MGLINDISEKIVPRTQELRETKGLDIKQALTIAFEETGYLKKSEEEGKNSESS